MQNRSETLVIVLRRSKILRSLLRLFALMLAGMVLLLADDLCDFSSRTVDCSLLDSCRPASARYDQRAAALASLPRKSEVTVLDESERRKMAAVREVLHFHNRAETYVLKIIDTPQAFTELNERTILLISRPTIQLLDAEELQALAAHEVGDEYIWNKYSLAKARTDKARLRELELVCDRTAIATLSQMMLPASALLTGLEKVFVYNREHFGIASDESLYPTVQERRANIERSSNKQDTRGSGETSLTFLLQRFVVTLDISFLPSFRGNRLSFNRETQNGVQQCFAARSEQKTKCPENFVGAVAIAKYSVRQRNGRPARHFTLRERVTTIDQHPDFPKRGVFERTVPTVNGVISDIQMFGYDEASVPLADRAQERTAADKVWGVYRQEVYANDDLEPFAIIEWRHTLRAITLVRADTVYKPANGSSSVRRPDHRCWYIQPHGANGM
jgi:hypothetical protein